MKGAIQKVGVAITLLLLLLTFGLNLNADNSAKAQTSGPEYFEGDMPVQGAYLRAINTYPGVTPDSDSDGVLDKGCTWDDDKDGVSEQHVVVNPLIVDLESNGFLPGEKVMLSFKQSMYSTTWNYFAFYVYGLFSSSKEIVTTEYVYTSSGGKGWPMVGPVNRVPGAIDAALGGYVHGPQDDTNSWKQGLEVENDIPEDFRIVIPSGYWDVYGKNGDVWSPSKWWWGNCFWITIPPGAKFLFLQLAGSWMIGDAGSCRITVDGDTDSDGIPNSWEKNGGVDLNKDNSTDLNLTGADWLKKDIFVEVDYMEGHRLNAVARDQVIAAFQNAPNPINLHIEIDDADNIPHNDSIRVDSYTGNWPDFDSIKKDHFGTPNQRNISYAVVAKSWAYHYCLMIHRWAKFNIASGKWEVTESSGIAEPYGNDFIVSLGWEGTIGEQAGTFMHELGHNLGLQHGGSDGINYKPNYLSIMNYFFQLPEKQYTRPLDYSRGTQPTLNEKDLDESKGIGDAPALWPTTVYSAPVWNNTGSYWRYVALPVSTAGAIDWNNNGEDGETSVQANLNYFPKWDAYSDPNETLEGFNDWANLRFRFQDTKDFKDGVHSTEFGADELTWDTVEAMRESYSQLHEVAVLNVTSSSSVWQQDTTAVLRLTLTNFGGYDENINVTVYANNTLIASATLLVGSGNSTSATLPYNGQTLTTGNYKLKAVINPVAGETYTADNTITGSVITVTGTIPELNPTTFLATFFIGSCALILVFRKMKTRG